MDVAGERVLVMLFAILSRRLLHFRHRVQCASSVQRQILVLKEVCAQAEFSTIQPPRQREQQEAVERDTPLCALFRAKVPGVITLERICADFTVRIDL